MVIGSLHNSYIVCKMPFVLFPRRELETWACLEIWSRLWELQSGEHQLWVGAEEEPANDLFPLDSLYALPRGRAGPPKPEHWAGKQSALKGLHILGCLHPS